MRGVRYTRRAAAGRAKGARMERSEEERMDTPQPSWDILQAVLEMSQDVLYAVALPEMRLVYGTPSFAQRLDLPHDFLSQGFGLPQYLCHIHPDDQDRVKDCVRTIVASRSGDDLPESPLRYRLLSPGGAWIHISDHYRVLRNPDGTPKLAIGNSRDDSDRQRAKEALCVSEQHFRQLIEAWPEQVMLSVNLDAGRHEYVSPSVERVLGYKPEDFYAEPGLGMSVVAPQWRAQAEEWMREINAGHVRPSYEFELVRKDGRQIWIHQVGMMRPTAPGQARAIQFTFRDITEERSRSEALRESEARFRELAEGWGDQVFVRMSLNTLHHDYVSPSMEKVFGYRPEQFYEGDPAALGALAPEWRETVAGWLEENARGIVRPQYEYEIIDAWGRRRWVLQRSTLVDGPYGPNSFLQSVLLDDTRSKELRQELAGKEALLQAMLRNLPFDFWARDKDGTVVMQSDESLRAWGDLSRGADAVEALDAATTTRWWHTNARVAAGEVVAEEREMVLANGEVRFCQSIVAPIREGEGMLGILGINVDITQRKMVEEALRVARDRYILLAENVVDVIWSTDEHLRWTYLSPSAETLTDVPVAQLMELRLEQMCTPASLCVVEQAVAEWAAAEPGSEQSFAPSLFEIVLTHFNGRDIPLEVIARPLFDGQGVLTGYCGTARDISLRKASEEALRLSNERYALLAENVADVIWTTDEKLRWTYLTPSAEKLSGYSLPEMLTMRFDQVFTPESLKAVAGSIEQRSNEIGQGRLNESHTLRLDLIRRDGVLVPLEVLVQPLFTPDGSVCGYCGTSRDISSRLKAEEALRTSEERYALALRGASDGIWDWDIVADRVYYSDRWKEIIGYGPNEMQHDPAEWVSRIHPEDNKRVMEENLRCIRGESPTFQVEYRLLHKDGEYRWIFGRGASLRDATGRVLRIAGAHTDITERVLAQEALRKSERLFRKLLASMHEGVWAVDKNRRTTFVNERLCAMVGYSQAELADMDILDVLAEEQRQAAMERIRERQKGLGGTIDYLVVRKDGVRFPAQVMSSPIMDEEGQFEGLVCGVVDLTERVRMEDELRRGQARSEALFELSRLTGTTERQIAAFTLRQALRLTGSTGGALYFLSPAGTELLSMAWENGADGLCQPVAAIPMAQDTPWTRVASGGVPVITNVFEHSAWGELQGHMGIRRFLGIPAHGVHGPAAVLGLCNKIQPYSADDVLQLSLLMDGMWRIVRGRRDEERIRASLREKEVLLREVHHRVKNNLQVISSLLDMSGRRLSTEEARLALAEVQSKVQAMSLIHGQLYGSRDVRGIRLGDYVDALFHQLREVYAGGLNLSARFNLGGLVLGLDQAVPLGLALNEALANVFKHAVGKPGKERSAQVEMLATQDETDLVTLTVSDNGPGLPPGLDPEKARGLGLKLMRGIVRQQLQGELHIANREGGGVRVTLCFRPEEPLPPELETDADLPEIL